MKNNKEKCIVFTGGGTGGHIYPGLAVVDELRKLTDAKIFWIGCSKGVDKDLVEKSGSVDGFIGIPCGKLRRYFSWQNFVDVFKVFAGFVSAIHYLRKYKPLAVFSKGGFVSVPSCYAAKLLKIPVFTHECDYSPGLATKLNSKVAKKIFVSFEETKKFFPLEKQSSLIVTGNPVRPIFYNTDSEIGKKFCAYEGNKPKLLILGGSLGALQINEFVARNVTWLCDRFAVFHQVGKSEVPMKEVPADYHAYKFIYAEMPHVMAYADLVFSRAGSNFLWECAVTGKPLILLPLAGNGSRGDQVENAKFFQEKGAAIALDGNNCTDEQIKDSLEKMLDTETRNNFSKVIYELGNARHPAETIAKILAEEVCL